MWLEFKMTHFSKVPQLSDQSVTTWFSKALLLVEPVV